MDGCDVVRPSVGSPGLLLGPLWAVLAALGASVGGRGVLLGPLWAVLGHSWGLCGLSWGGLGRKVALSRAGVRSVKVVLPS